MAERKRNPLRLHDRESFYKHVTASTALLVLQNCKIRWSAPGLFNDPFDVPETICDGVDELALHHAVVDAMNRLVEKPTLPHPEHHTVITRILITMIQNTNATQRQELHQENENHRRESQPNSHALDELREFWRTEYPNHRILCFTERWDSASMWDRYSGGHTGAILEFACLDESDSAWLMAKPVRYTDEPLKLNTAAGIADLLFYTPEFAVSKILEEYTHTKTKDWDSEREWRVASWKRTHETGTYMDYEFLPIELKGVTLGARMNTRDKEAVLAEIAKTFPHAEVWQSSIDVGRIVRRTRLK